MSRAPISMTQAVVKTGETCPISEPSVVHPPNPKSHGKSEDVETAGDLPHNKSSKRTSETNTDIETAYEPRQHPPSRLSDPASTIENDGPTTENIPRNKTGHSSGGK